MQVEFQNIVQVITNNASNYKVTGCLIETLSPHSLDSLCCSTFNLVLKNICAAKVVEDNTLTYEQYYWISYISEDMMVQ